ncbi:hypothetical protein N7468_010435 [Penicillium chermesinum]|uniref:Uncharacterized protein n=1 Tax=Penicillium chermesinum TaxID=63820 RepID=A0A9W9TC84_9EURO|nr:uncharacterized protein N7468_010435 [Penicillium chermesinum]KAJ5217427.1 hypothetical protein N7468_010435 [Penicillium chermesinum]
MLSTLALLTAGSAQNQGPPAGYYPPQQNQQTTTTTYYNSPAPNQQGYPPQQAPGGVAPERKAERSTGRPARHNTSNNSNNLTSSPISKPLGTMLPVPALPSPAQRTIMELPIRVIQPALWEALLRWHTQRILWAQAQLTGIFVASSVWAIITERSPQF